MSYSDLFAQCFPGTEKLGTSYLHWLYVDNPSGRMVGFNAFAGSRLVAHYAVIPVHVEIEGAQHLACWSLNTATHPEFQGRGLFTKLAELTYERAAEHGCIGVIGVANRNSVNGFVRRLAFAQLGQVSMRIGFGYRLLRGGAGTLHRIWTDPLIRWRLENPVRRYYRGACDGRVSIHALAPRTGTPILLGCVSKDSYAVHNLSSLPYCSAIQPRIVVGFGIDFGGTSLAVPNWILPSPWNVIYRPLSSNTGSRPDLSILGMDMDTF
ncbi:MAG: GNAT family N-acetyltransferase [Nitrospiraceae bacterium]